MSSERRDGSETSITDLWLERIELDVGGLSRPQLLDALRLAGVSLNAHAEALIAHPVFEEPVRERIRIVDRTVAELGFRGGATLPRIYAAAEELGLGLCPVVTGPYLRLAWATQADSSNSVLSAESSPDGAVNVASPVLNDDVEFPKGFYLRVVDGQSWLRGYRCDDLYVLAPDVRFAFRQPA
ncbi:MULTISPECIES: hypothetical protein [unclassified Microbacterium]|uniref:hypothetical protein n=1 Tax=unclassified Microbacterium TaxID=2609290 RepID=UPI001E4C4C4E|nr:MULTISPECIES: hypothetical protein [unclassified Microbacterium]